MVFKIVLDSNRILPGETISGKVVMSHNDEKKIRGMVIKLTGKEKTLWKEGKSTISDFRVFYGGEQRPLQPGKLPAGRHEIPFSFFVNPDLPATFHGTYGSIKYKVRAELDIVMESDDNDVEEVLVLSLINLNNTAPALRVPNIFNVVKEISDWGCGGETSIALDLKLEKQGFALGELIEMQMNCDNTSDVDIVGFDIELTWVTIYRANPGACDGEYRTRKEKQQLSRLTDAGVQAHENKNLNISFGVPVNYGLPNFIGCELFQSRCNLKIVGITEGLHFNVKLKVPIVLGHIAYTSSRRPSPANIAPPMAMPMPMPMPMPGSYTDGLAVPPSAPRDENSSSAPPYMAPPSYEQAMSYSQKEA